MTKERNLNSSIATCSIPILVSLETAFKIELKMQFMFANIEHSQTVAAAVAVAVAVAVGFEAMSGKCNATLIGRS